MSDPTPQPAPPLDTEMTAMAAHASNFVQVAANHTGYSLLQLNAMFRIAATICEEKHWLNEKSEMARYWRNNRR